nr:glycogen synthesis kinase-like kinase [Cryptomonas curvata]
MSLVGNQRYSVIGRVVGSGSFGVVFQAKVRSTEETVAIKKVFQDDRYENREVEIMSMLNHSNILDLRHCFNFSEGNELYYNLELDFFAENIHRVCQHYSNHKQTLPLVYVKLYMYQVIRALSYLHLIGICHRDIKPQNLLIDPATQHLKLGDFGSAKLLTVNEPSISYICSRYYRAPELLLGAIDYTNSIDMWSTGCVMGELLIGFPFFRGESGTDQLVEIIKVLGTPTKAQVRAMNNEYLEFQFPKLAAHPWENVFHGKSLSLEAVDLISKMLDYLPFRRIRSIEAISHHFFDELRKVGAKLPNTKAFPYLFDLQKREFEYGKRFTAKIIPLRNLQILCKRYLYTWQNSSRVC